MTGQNSPGIVKTVINHIGNIITDRKNIMTKVNICYGTCDETTYEVDYVIVEALDHTEDQFRPRRLWIQGSKEQVKEMLTKAWDKYLIYIEANGESWATMGSYQIKEHPEGIWNFKVTVIPTVTIPLY